MAVYTLIQNTQVPFVLPTTGNGVTDLTLVTSAYIIAHRNVSAAAPAGTSTETWTAVTFSATDADNGTATCTPQASGTGSVTVAGELIDIRLMLSFASGPDVATKPQARLSVVEQ